MFPITINLLMMSSSVFTESLLARQSTAATLIANAVAGGKLVHAYLLTGRSVDDKWAMARELAAYLNCDKRKEGAAQPCYIALKPEVYCQNCKWIFDGKHPKALMVLGPEGSKSGKIAVEKARALSDELSKTSSYVRLVVVETASEASFHRPCANALLKTIEEPRTDCLFMLFAGSQEEVLPTVVSRCQVVPLANRPEANLGPLQFAIREPGAKLAVALNADGERATAIDGAAERLRKLPFFCVPCPLPAHRAEPGSARATQSLSDALELSEHLQKILDDEVLSIDDTLDTLVELELRSLKSRLPVDSRTFAYMQGVMNLAEDAKQHLGSFVSKKAAFESFALRWAELRQQKLC